MVKLSRKERKEQAGQKKEEVRREIFRAMCAAEKVKNLDPVITVNKAIDIMMRKDPQESHFIRAVCNEIRSDVKGFAETMIKRYGVPDVK